MKVEAKTFDSIEIEDPLDDFRPADISNFGTWIRVGIGTSGSPAADNFEILVCTPTWLDSYIEGEKDGAAWGRHMLIVSHYDVDQIKRAVERLVSRCGSDDWVSTAQKIARFAHWEFEDYAA
ncbi:hypothetical protein R69927_02799 [Paraburkholderia domus]|jgi:hypothetical protein|uniref:Immunity protein 8 n=1 Tax=Paraburkholderia domus TaxID=2793075 RepID=A0A9N8MV68_9BURK|nr:immunity 8 family protein [Paraburkholderia domus]MBK5047437.1 immunity 8 family protein [Burkholderia sp. R-70006]MBK5059295.1 immunity 8 family protein [Burkholderia sp. R-70199]MBK5087096.1 immunity 8 family protein [Burkholderia sp. R-69927]MBK5119389.1 immunity 8 family protein [Burkholderia sp. R-69980]MBK5163377.1 immunity 8 family protein [Burkholderia sp. R-70211]MBK5179179.1 immunity 8 family protein [Burkholderia sp. R-69749]MCI0145454.1 immunity 8 family protein [Paraburkholde